VDSGPTGFLSHLKAMNQAVEEAFLLLGLVVQLVTITLTINTGTVRLMLVEVFHLVDRLFVLEFPHWRRCPDTIIAVDVLFGLLLEFFHLVELVMPFVGLVVGFGLQLLVLVLQTMSLSPDVVHEGLELVHATVTGVDQVLLEVLDAEVLVEFCEVEVGRVDWWVDVQMVRSVQVTALDIVSDGRFVLTTPWPLQADGRTFAEPLF